MDDVDIQGVVLIKYVDCRDVYGVGGRSYFCGVSRHELLGEEGEDDVDSLEGLIVIAVGWMWMGYSGRIWIEGIDSDVVRDRQGSWIARESG